MKIASYLLRLAVFLTFFAHGIIAIKGNVNWFVYLETVGFSLEASENILPIIGTIDVLVAIVVLLKPIRVVVLWAIIWAFSVALIRPISGEPIWAFVERGSFWITPLVLYILIFKNQK